jgi:hypothetical protein
MVLALVACSRSPDPRPAPPEAATTTSTVASGGLSATCAAERGNALRWRCDVTADPPGDVAVAYQDTAGVRPERIAIPADGQQALVFLAPHTEYVYRAYRVDDPSQTAVGWFTTGEVPDAARLAMTGEGESDAALLGFTSPCQLGAAVLIADPRTGEVLWYHDFTDGGGGVVEGVAFTEDHTVLALVDGEIREVDLVGDELLRLSPGLDFALPVHHDVFRKDGLTWALFDELAREPDGQDYLLDGFYAFDPGGAKVVEWHLKDHFTPPAGSGDPVSLDYSHANAIWVDDDQRVTFSMRGLSAFAYVDGDPGSPAFGEIVDRVANPDSPFGSDHALATAVGGPADFEHQHNVHTLPDGHVTLLDNRISYAENSRVIELALEAGLATITAAWELPEHCDYEGGAWRTSSGHPLATCAPSRTAYEFDPTSGAVVWTARADCDGGFPAYVPRFVPLDW